MTVLLELGYCLYASPPSLGCYLIDQIFVSIIQIIAFTLSSNLWHMFCVFLYDCQSVLCNMIYTNEGCQCCVIHLICTRCWSSLTNSTLCTIALELMLFITRSYIVSFFNLCMNFRFVNEKKNLETKSIQRTQTPPRLILLTLMCDLDVRSRKLMSLDVAYCIVTRYQI